MKKECVFLKDKHHLIAPADPSYVKEPEYQIELKFTRENFCGNLHDRIESFASSNASNDPGSIVYLCGNIREIYSSTNILENRLVYIIKELSVEYEDVNSNANSDVNSDVNSDANSDVNSNANSDASSDASSDTQSDVNSNAQSNANSETRPKYQI